MMNSIRTLVFTGMLLCVVFTAAGHCIAQSSGSDTKPTVEIDLAVDDLPKCRPGYLDLKVKVKNVSGTRLVFFPDLIWSRQTFTKPSVIKDGVGHAGVYYTIGHSSKDDNENGVRAELGPDESIVFRRSVRLTTSFFQSSSAYTLYLSYYDLDRTKAAGIPFLKEARSNEISFTPKCSTAEPKTHAQ